MKLGIVFPHHEIGTDPGAVKAYAIGAEALGADHMLIYDHVLGADPNRPGGWRGPYDKDVAFHEPFTVFLVHGGTHDSHRVRHMRAHPAAAPDRAGGEAGGGTGHPVRQPLPLGHRHRWNEVEYEALAVPFAARGRRQTEQVHVLRQLWSSESLTYAGKYHRITQAGILPRPRQDIPIWFGGIAPALLKRCATLGDGWFPLGGPNEASANALRQIKSHREAAGLSWQGFGVQAQAQYRGGNPARWRIHASRWRDLGCTHLAIATHNAGNETVDAHLAAAGEFFEALRDPAA